MTPMLITAERLPIAGRDCPASRQGFWSAGRPVWFVLLAVAFVAVSFASWGQQVTTVEMNRNDASCYLILARNLVRHGCYSLDQAAPFRPHTEWPPGVPLFYVPVMAVVGDFPLSTTDEALVHCWSLCLAVGSLWLLWRYLREVTSPLIALGTTALLASTHAFLDSANASTADALSVGAAFWALREVERYFREGRSGWRDGLRVHLTLAVVPLIKPYLGMVFVVYLWNVLTTSRCWRRFAAGIGMLALCCVPFAGFIAYSVIAAEQTGDISAVSWLVTDNPTATQAGVATADQKTLGEWMQGGVRTLRYFLIYNVTQSVWSPLSWFGFSEWSAIPRLGVMLLTFVVMGLGAARLCVTKNTGSVVYSLAMLAFFVVFACDSPRYFTVLSPMCALLFCEGGLVLSRCRMARRGEWLSARWDEFGRGAMACCAVVVIAASGLWASHRLSDRVDPEPFYREVYATLREAREHAKNTSSDMVLFVPYQLKSVAIVESACSVQTYEEAERAQEVPNHWVMLTVKHDPIGRIRPTGDQVMKLQELTSDRHGTGSGPRWALLKYKYWPCRCCPSTGADE